MTVAAQALRVSALIVAAVAAGCGKPTEIPVRPEQVMDATALFQVNCAGCHGVDGRRGIAQPLNDPLYLALIDETRLRRVIAHGVPGTPMPAFATDAGGTLTNEQIRALVNGMKRNWGSGGPLTDLTLPAYSESDAIARGLQPGDPDRGRLAYATACTACHGPDGRGASAGSIVDRDFLALTSDQALRTTIIAGRADARLQGWCEYAPERPMGPQEISDLVAWLSVHRGHHD